MGWNKKTWLALALAIVLVLGLSAVALADDSVTLTASSIETGTTAGTTKVTVSFDTAPATGQTVSLTAGTAGIVTITPATIATDGTKTSFEFTATAVKPGKTAFTAKLGATTVATSSDLSVDPAAIKFSIDALTLKSAQSTGTSTFTVQDTITSDVLVPADDISAATAGKISFRSSEPTVATVAKSLTTTNAFVVTALAPGKTTLTATYGTGISAKTATLEVFVVPATLQPEKTAGNIEPFYLNTSGGATAGTYSFKIQGTTSTAWADLLAGTELTIVQTPANAVTITPVDTTFTTFTVTPGTAAGKVKLVAQYKAGTETITVDVAEINVLDPLKVQSFAVKMGADVLDPAKDTTALKVDFLGTTNAYLFEVPITGIEPQSASAVTDLTATKPASITWTTTTPKVVKITKPAVDADGKVKTGETLKAEQATIEFLKTGTAKLKVTVDGVSRSFTFSVGNLKATAITAIPDMTMVKNQYKRPVVGTTPAAARTNLTYKSNKTSVATVGKTSGVIKAVKSGTAKITVTDSISKLKASFTVTVGTDISKIKYKGFALTTPWNNMTWDLVGLAGVVQSATYNGIAFGDPYMTDAEQQTWANLKAHLAEYKVGGTKAMTEDDIFAFYFNGKINSKGEIELGKTGDAIYPPEVVPIDTLLKELVDIPGTIFLVMDCDMSSLALTSKGGTELTPAQFNNMVINSVKRKSLQAKTIGTAAADAGSYKQKFKVLVATSKKSQTANYTSVTQGEGAAPTTYRSGWLTQHLIEGLNPYTIGNMPADANKNKIVTLKELYNYVNKAVKAEVTAYNKANSSAKVKQVVSVYPAKGDAFPIYARVKPTAFEIDLG